MVKYHINLKNGDFFTVEVEEGQPAPVLYVEVDNTLKIVHMPTGWSVDPSAVVYIEPADDDD